jgi:methylmalonyl-CoA/ethylmalonyl-CoA epimerase
MHIDHVAIVVEDLEAAVEAYEAVGLVRYDVYDDIVEQYPGEEELHYRACAVMESRDADFHIWLMEPKGEGTALHRFLERRGPGLHHIGIDGPLDGVAERLAGAGIAFIRPVSDFGKEGRRGLLDPHDLQGTLVELTELPEH